MNNLTTRKIVFGMLIVLVLAFSMLGNPADALTIPTISSNPVELSTLNTGSTITLTVSTSFDNSTVAEALTIGVSGANFPDVDNPATSVSTETWREVDGTGNTALVGTTFDKPLSPLVITVSTAGKVVVTVTWTRSDMSSTTSTTRTFYVVSPIVATATDIAFNPATDINDTGFEFKSGGDHDIGWTVTPSNTINIPITVAVTSGGTLFVQEGNRKGTVVTTLNTSSAASVRLTLTSTSTITISHRHFSDRVTYIYGLPTVTITGGNDKNGTAGNRLDQALTVRVTGSGLNLPGIPVVFNMNTRVGYLTTAGGGIFIPVSGTTVYTTAAGILSGAATAYTTMATSLSPIPRSAGEAIVVQTDAQGNASTYFQFNSAATAGQVAYIDAQVSGVAPALPFKQTVVTSNRIPTIEIDSGNNQRADSNGELANPLVVLVKNAGQRISAKEVIFSTRVKGLLVGEFDDNKDGMIASGEIRGPSQTITIPTNSSGIAQAEFFLGDASGTAEVAATISGIAPTAYTREVIFTINGTGITTPPPPTNTITISPSTIDGEPGEEVTIRVTSSPSNVFATLGSNDFGATRFSPQSDFTPFTSTLLLPVEEGTHSFFATGGTFTAGRASVTVEAELGELSITAIGTPEAGLQTFSISAVDADGDRASAPFTARLSGTGFTSRNVEISGGRGNARVTLPTAARLYTLTVSATGYEDGETPVRIAGTGQQQVADEDEEEVEEEVTVAAEPDSIEITGPSTRSGTVNEELDTPLLVRVLDDDGDGLEGARVFYRVSSGRGRLSARGNGRAIGVVTDDDGYARASFTPLDGGTITVRANTDDLSATVTFTITTGSAPTTTRGPGTGVASSTSVNPVVHVAAASRPPMLWVDGGAIYALVGASPQRFAASVDNALNITVGGGKVYWTEKTGESGGTINSANLNGSGVTELASIFATPMGIAVDVTNSKLYWTNSAGRIQSANLDGSRITNVIPGGLETPMDLALAGGNAYWTQGGNVRFVNLRGTKQIRNISTGTDTAGSLAIGGGKVYWTETTGGSGGTVNSANLNGTGATQLASILAAPIGIAVDGSRSKLYWSNARGRIQSANLDGSKITNVVSGLGSPGELVLSNSIAMPTAAATTTTTTTASNAKYDVNSDGLVDNTDAGLVADAMGTSNARYDVNGDGTVNFLDLLLVFDNRDPGAAGAPTIVGMKMSAAQIDIIEEQIDLLIATNDRSPSAMRVLVYLQQLLVTARPEKTQLLANYPNPFNPETWIPYELATDTNVRLTIYNTQGVVIRTLQFGHQSAGYYVGRDRAAYWDGRNALGEQVASGFVFLSARNR